MNDEQLERKIEELENRVERLTGEKDENSGGISRRGFLKKSALGLAGLGALTLPAAGKISITGSGIEKNGNDYFHSGLTTDYDLAGENLTDGGTTVFDASQQEFTDTATPDTGKRTIPFNIPTVNLQPGETAQLARFQLSSSQQLDIEKASVSRIDGTTSSNLELEVYNHGTSTSEYTTTSTYSEGSPLATIKRQEVEIRVKNTSGSTTINAQAAATGTTEEIPLTLEDFEDGDASEYSVLINKGSYSVQSSTVHSGNYALRMKPDNPDSIFIAATGGDYSLSQGQKFEFYWRGYVQDAAFFGFGWQGESVKSGYLVQGFNQNDVYELERWDSGSRTSLASGSVNWSSGVWYRTVVDWANDGTITATTYDDNSNKLDSITATDSNYTSGGIAFWVFSNNENNPRYFDDVRII
ncbi:MAG: twin-arginine translocation signal domain-containing protein [Candidatus Nanohaloarchaea archaeon]